MRLKDAAEWNQTEEDWLRLFRLAPEGCFGIEDNGVLAASATVACYGAELAWIGMVLTLPEFRGRGYARTLMEHSIEHAGDRAIRLDASDMGRPLYESLGFVAECAIERWRRDAAPAPSSPAVVALAYDERRDRLAFGADRSRLLQDLAAQGGASYGSSWAFVRPGSSAAFFGPCVAASEAEASELLTWFTANHSSAPAVLDLFPDHPMAAIAEQLGFRPFRTLTRMVRRPVAPASPHPEVFAVAGFEWG